MSKNGHFKVIYRSFSGRNITFFACNHNGDMSPAGRRTYVLTAPSSIFQPYPPIGSSVTLVAGEIDLGQRRGHYAEDPTH